MKSKSELFIFAAPLATLSVVFLLQIHLCGTICIFFWPSVNYCPSSFVLIDFLPFPFGPSFFSSTHPPSSSLPLLSPSSTRHTCYFFVQGPVIKFDISEGIKYVVWVGERGLCYNLKASCKMEPDCDTWSWKVWESCRDWSCMFIQRCLNLSALLERAKNYCSAVTCLLTCY